PAQLPCEHQALAVDAVLGEHDEIERLAAQAGEHAQPGGKDANARLAGRAVLELRIAVYHVEMRIAFQHRSVVGVHQRGEMSLRIACAQGSDERRGADKIADVVAPDDEESHAVRQRAPQASSTPATPQNSSEFWRTNSMSVMLRVSMPASSATSAMPQAAVAAFVSLTKRRAWRSVAASRTTKSTRPIRPVCKARSRNRLCECQASSWFASSGSRSRSRPRPKP